MTQKAQDKLKSIAKGFFPYFATPAMIIFLIWGYATDKEKNKSVQFSNQKIKVDTENHILTKPNDVDVYKEFLELKKMKADDSIHKLNAMEAIIKRRKAAKNDSLEAVENWKMSQAIQKINKKLNINN